MSRQPDDTRGGQANRQREQRNPQQTGEREQRGRQQPQRQGRRQGRTQRPGGYGTGGAGIATGPNFAQYGKFAIGGHLLFGLGMTLTVFLFLSLAPGGGTASGFLFEEFGSGNLFFASVIFAFVFTIFLSALPTLGIGLFIGNTASNDTQPAAISAAVNSAGLLVTVLVLFLLALITAPGGGGGGGGSDIGSLFGPLIGTLFAVALVGAGAGALGDRIDMWFR